MRGEQGSPGEHEGVLVLAGTPLGNLGDASPRLAEELAAADVVAAEDTRRLDRLVRALGVGVRARVVSNFEGNEVARTPALLDELREGRRVLLVTDAGMPGVSDPGYRLVRAAADAGVRVTALPGPSAVTTALAVSGLPVDRFCFEGFLPRRAGERAARLRELAGEPRTLVFFESPRRLAATLRAMADAFGPERAGAVCRELTKLHEEVRRDRLDALARWADEGARGEVTLVVGGAPRRDAAEQAEPDDVARLVAAHETAGVTRKEAIATVAAELGLPKRIVYDAVLAAKEG